MQIDQAQTILNAITVGAGALWLLGTWYVVRSASVGKALVPPEPQPFVVHDRAVSRAVTGTQDIDRSPEENLATAVHALVTGVGHRLGSVRIAEQTHQYIRFESSDKTGVSAYGMTRLGNGEIWFSMQTNGKTHVDYAIEVGSGRGLLSAARIVNVIGLIAIAFGYLAISKWIIPDPANRAQVFQMLQTIHFLWPPFLFAALYRRQYSVVSAEVETFIHNLPYLNETSNVAR